MLEELGTVFLAIILTTIGFLAVYGVLILLGG